MTGVLRHMGNDVQFDERRHTLLSIVTLVIAAIFALETLVPCPRLNQRANDAEMFARRPALLLGKGQNRVETFDHGIMGNQAFALLKLTVRGRWVDAHRDQPSTCR